MGIPEADRAVLMYHGTSEKPENVYHTLQILKRDAFVGLTSEAEWPQTANEGNRKTDMGVK